MRGEFLLIGERQHRDRCQHSGILVIFEGQRGHFFYFDAVQLDVGILDEVIKVDCPFKNALTAPLCTLML